MDYSGVHRIAKVFFKVKIHMACNSRYNKNNRMTKNPDHRAKRIISKYNNKFKKLDRVFAEEVVGNRETGVTGPFQTAQDAPTRDKSSQCMQVGLGR